MIEPELEQFSVAKQCEIVGLNESSYYYETAQKSPRVEVLMRNIDEIYTKWPFYGSRKISFELVVRGIHADRRTVAKHMREMGLEAIYCKPKTSTPHPEHQKYPYLLRGLIIDRPNQVWCADITYIRMQRGWTYLVAIMDWFSRYVLSWKLSITMDTEFCENALSSALKDKAPEVFNTDQGSQFTSQAFTGLLKNKGVTISMDGKGRAFDNIFVERLWRSVKYEEVYLNECSNVQDARNRLDRYFRFYNEARIHQGLGYRTPREVYAA